MRLDPLSRFLVLNLLLGIAVAALAAAGVLLLDVQGVRRLIVADQSPILALLLLLLGFTVTFGSGVMGTAIMRLGDR
jgi:hypothetical protein